MLGFDYNPASQVITESRDNDAYAYRGDYNVTRSYAANGLNQYTSAGPASFTYDMNGNLTSDGAVTYAYDIENRIIGASGAKTANLKYDPLGRLYEVNAGSPASATRFLYDGDALVAEYDASSGALARRYVHGSGVDEPLVWYEGATLSNRRTLRANHQGSVIAVADGAGSSIGALTYDPYGIPGAANFGRFQYTGQIWLKELGVYHYKARAYSPTLGRFLQTDPIGYEDQVNLYAYVGNDPGNGTDSTGTCQDGGKSCDRVMEANRKAGEQVARSPTKVDDAVAGGAVLLMAAPAIPIIMAAGSEVAAVATVATAEAAPAVTSITAGVAERAAMSLTAPTTRPTMTAVANAVAKATGRQTGKIAEVVQPAGNAARQTQSLANVAQAQKGTVVPATTSGKIAEAFRFIMRLILPIH